MFKWDSTINFIMAIIIVCMIAIVALSVYTDYSLAGALQDVLEQSHQNEMQFRSLLIGQ